MSFSSVGRQVIEGVSAGLYEAGTILMGESQILVPVEFGVLKRSGQVEEPVVEGDSVSVTVGYGYGNEVNPETGDEAVGYAKWVEVRDDLKHKPPTQAHYLGEPAKAMGAELPGIIEYNVQARLRS